MFLSPSSKSPRGRGENEHFNVLNFPLISQNILTAYQNQILKTLKITHHILTSARVSMLPSGFLYCSPALQTFPCPVQFRGWSDPAECQLRAGKAQLLVLLMPGAFHAFLCML